MSESNPSATVKKCSYPGCDEKAWPELGEARLCLGHWPENGKTRKLAQRVWRRAREKVEKNETNRRGELNFRGWHFPWDPDGKGFNGATFKGPAWFGYATFEGDARFDGATFEDWADFHGATFEGWAWFVGATFEDGAGFGHATFKGGADFVGATFGTAGEPADADFTGARFEENALFHGARFSGAVSFHDATVAPGKQIGFPLEDSAGERRTVFLRREQGESAYRLAKQAAIMRGANTSAGNYYYAERCARELGMRRGLANNLSSLGKWLKTKAMTCWRPPHELRQTFLEVVRHSWSMYLEGALRWFWDWAFGKWVFGYGEKPHRALIAGGAVILLWAALYFGIGITSSEGEPFLHDVGKSLYFSVVTFTTLGYGDLQPVAGWGRFLAGTEALLGAGLLATFIVGLTRRFMR